MTTNSLSFQEPSIYHREYTNDLGEASKKSWTDQSNLERVQRVTTVALPFITLYKPASFPVSLGLGGLRVLSTVSELISSIQAGKDTKTLAYQTLQTTIAVISLAGTIFAHPVGMLITTGQDLLVEVKKVAEHVKNGDYKQAIEACVRILNNSLYLALMLHGGLELSIASIASQILQGLYLGMGEFKEGRILEGTGHIAMALVRGNQMHKQIQAVQHQEKLHTLKQAMENKKLALLKAKQENPSQVHIQNKEDMPENSEAQDRFEEILVWIESLDVLEDYPDISEDAARALAHATVALRIAEEGYYNRALRHIDLAFSYYQKCERNGEDMSHFNDFELLLDYYRGVVHLYLGDYAEAQKILANYSPYHDLRRSALYKLIEKATNIEIFTSPEQLRSEGALDDSRWGFANPRDAETMKAINRAAYIAFTENSRKAQQMIEQMHLSAVDRHVHAETLAAIAALNGNLAAIKEPLRPDFGPCDLGSEIDDQLYAWLANHA